MALYLFLSLFRVFAFASWAASDLCPSWTKDPDVLKSIGKCPKPNESRLLHSADSYPELAVVISEQEPSKGLGVTPPSPRYKLGTKNPTQAEKSENESLAEMNRKFVAESVVAALTRANDKPPIIFLPVSDETFAEVKARVVEASKTDKALQQKWEKALVQLKDIPEKGKVPSFTWQQDYFKAVVNSHGGIELRYLEFYGRGTEKFVDKLFDKMAEACPLLKRGPYFNEPSKLARRGDWENAYFGGNIMGGPQGTCWIGDNQETEFSQQFCPDASKHVRLPVSWLLVGHVDEVVSLVPKNGGKGPCDFAVITSSPESAIKALEEEPNAPFFGFSTTNEKKAKERVTSLPVRYFCEAVFGHPTENPIPAPGGNPEKPPTHKSGAWELFSKAWAAEEDHETFESQCLALTNRQVLAFLARNEEFRTTQKLVQRKMEETKAIIRKKYPGCAVEFKEVPDLYFGGHLVQKKDPIDRKLPLEDQFELPEREMSSLLPSSANSEVFGDGIVAPDPHNGAFAKALKRVYSELNLKPKFVDTFDYAHVGYGNLHCATQTIRWCQP